MSGSASDLGQALTPLLTWAAAAGLVGLAVKLLDDTLDQPGDPTTLAGRLGEGATLAYGLAAGVAGVALAPAVGLALFAASYALGMVGMGAGPGERLPSRLPAWVESLAALGASLLLAGVGVTGGAFGALLAVQALDDLADWCRDGEVPALRRRSLAGALGRVGAGAVAVAGLLLGLAFDWRVVAAVALAVPVVLVVSGPASGRGARHHVRRAAGWGLLLAGAVAGAGLVAAGDTAGALPRPAGATPALSTPFASPRGPGGAAVAAAGTLVALGLAYGAGRRQGRRLGEQAGRSVAPLLLRERALREGACPLCSAGPGRKSSDSLRMEAGAASPPGGGAGGAGQGGESGCEIP